MKKIARGSGGFTLIEIIISLLILSIVMAGGMTLYFNADKISALMLHKRIAMELADKKMEEIRDTTYSSLTVGEIEENNLKVSGLNARRKVTITEPASDYKRVEVKVNWKEAGSTQDNTVQLLTYISP